MEPEIQAEANTQVNDSDPDVEYVPIQDVSDEEVSRLLKEALDEEEQTAPDSAQEDGTEATAANVEPEPKPEPAKKPSEPSFVKPSEVPEQLSKEKAEEFKRKFEQQETFLRRRSTELGEERKLRRENEAKLHARIKELESNFEPGSQSQLFDAKLALRDNQQRMAELDAEDASNNQAYTSQRLFLDYVPESDRDFSGMADLLESEGTDLGVLNQFRKDPFRTMSPDGLIQLALRNRDRKVLKGRDEAIVKLATLTKRLIAEREQFKAKPDKLLQDVEAKLKRGPTLTGKNGTGNAGQAVTGLSAEEISSLTNDELKALRKRLG